jgi:hypothetical protein
MCLVQIKQAQIKFPLSGFWTVQLNHKNLQICDLRTGTYNPYIYWHKQYVTLWMRTP